MSVRRENRKIENGESRGVWVVDVVATNPDGTEVRVKKQSHRWSKADAVAYERTILRSIASGEYSKTKEEQSIPTLAEFAEEFINGYAKLHNKPSEVEGKKSHLRLHLLPKLAHRRLCDLKLRDIEKLKTQLLDKGLKPKTVNNALATLGKLLHYAVEVEVISTAPRIKLLKSPPPEFDFLTFDEAESLLNAAQYNSEWHAMIYFALRTGVRYGELCEVRWSDVDLQHGRVVIR